MNNELDISPRKQQLKEEYERLQQVYSELITKRDDLLQHEIPRLEALYMEAIGQLQYEELCLQYDIALLKFERDLYNGGTVLLLYAVLTLTFPRDEGYTFDSFIGMDCPPPNWNEGLDPELTKDLHLISQFHNLFQHMLFAITDFIYVREFRTEINIEIIK